MRAARIFLTSIAAISLIGCGNVSAENWQYAEKACAPNDGVFYVEGGLFWGDAHCKNGAIFSAKVLVDMRKEVHESR